MDTSLLFLNRVRSKNPLKEGRFWKFSKVSARRSRKTWKGLGEISRAKKSANPCTDDMSLSRTALYLRSVEASFPRCKTNPKHYPDRGSDTSLVWNFCARSSDVISARGNQWWRRELLAVFSGYWKLWHCTVLSIYQHQNASPKPTITHLASERGGGQFPRNLTWSLFVEFSYGIRTWRLHKALRERTIYQSITTGRIGISFRSNGFWDCLGGPTSSNYDWIVIAGA